MSLTSLALNCIYAWSTRLTSSLAFFKSKLSGKYIAGYNFRDAQQRVSEKTFLTDESFLPSSGPVKQIYGHVENVEKIGKRGNHQ